MSAAWSIITGDCTATMNNLAAGSVALVVADPPYNVGIDYGMGSKADRLPAGRYAAWAAEWVAAAARVLRPGGALFVICDRGGQRLHEEAVGVAGLEVRDVLVWHETFGADRSAARLYGKCWRPIIWATKPGARWTFNDRAIRVRSRRQELGDRRADPRGKVPANVWAFPRIPGTSKRRATFVDPATGDVRRYPTQLPVEIVDRIVAGHSAAGEIVLDPFTGSGTTGVSAVTAGRVFVGIERHEPFAAAARRRVAAAVGG